jgi:hypothetical protein
MTVRYKSHYDDPTEVLELLRGAAHEPLAQVHKSELFGSTVYLYHPSATDDEGKPKRTLLKASYLVEYLEKGFGLTQEAAGVPLKEQERLLSLRNAKVLMEKASKAELKAIDEFDEDLQHDIDPNLSEREQHHGPGERNVRKDTGEGERHGEGPHPTTQTPEHLPPDEQPAKEMKQPDRSPHGADIKPMGPLPLAPGEEGKPRQEELAKARDEAAKAEREGKAPPPPPKRK